MYFIFINPKFFALLITSFYDSIIIKKIINMNKYVTLLAALLLILSFGCSQTITTVTDKNLTDRKYDTDFVQINENNKIDELVNSVKMLNSIAYYKSYIFDIKKNITLEKLKNTGITKESYTSVYSTETASGTATVIYSHNGKTALLTCAHVLDFPDTLINFFKDKNGRNTDIIESVTIKSRQTNILPELTPPNKIDVLILDDKNDIAIIGSDELKDKIKLREVLSLKAGSSNELTWGTKVYMIGFPLNYKMITSGLVSPIRNTDKSYFLVDAIFNKGFSGGLVLGVRDGAPNFEIVGMVKSGTVNRSLYLKPNVEKPDFKYLPKVPYNDEIIVDEEAIMKYGVTKIMGIETILDFMSNNSVKLKNLGYNLDMFFRNEKPSLPEFNTKELKQELLYIDE